MELVMPEMAEMKRQFDSFMAVATDFLVTSCNRSVVTVSDIARIEGVPICQLRKGGTQRYLLPRFGESGYPTGVIRWDVREYIEWKNQDPKERQRAWLASLENKKNQL